MCVCCCSRANDVSLTSQGTDQCIPREPVPLAGTRLFCALPDYQKPEQKEEGGARPTVPKSRTEQIRNHPPSYAALRRRAPITNLKCSIEKSAHEGEREIEREAGRKTKKVHPTLLYSRICVPLLAHLCMLRERERVRATLPAQEQTKDRENQSIVDLNTLNTPSPWASKWAAFLRCACQFPFRFHPVSNPLRNQAEISAQAELFAIARYNPLDGVPARLMMII